MHQHQFTPAQAASGHATVFLLDHKTALERRLLLAWLRDAVPDGPGAETLSLRDGGGRFRSAALQRIKELCDAPVPPFFVPVRVLWLARQGDRPERAGLADFVSGDPRAPGALRQRWIVSHDPTGDPPIPWRGVRRVAPSADSSFVMRDVPLRLPTMPGRHHHDAVCVHADAAA